MHILHAVHPFCKIENCLFGVSCDWPMKDSSQKAFRALPSFQLGLLASLVERQVNLRYQRKFGLKLSEAHIIGVVGSLSPVGFKKMCQEAGVEKSSASRQVSRLIEKGVIQKFDDAVDQRAFYLAITAKGKRLYNELLSDANERNEQWMSVLSSKRQDSFLADVDILLASAREMLRMEEAQEGTDGSKTPSGEWRDTGSQDQEEKRPVLLNESAATQLIGLLQKLLQQ